MTNTPDLEAAKAAAAEGQAVPDMRKRKAKGKGEADGAREPELFGLLKPDCPVTALGVQGDKIWLLDRFNQLQCFKPDELRKGVISLIFGHDYALEEWPQKKLMEGTGKNGIEPKWVPNGKIDQDAVQNAVIAACAAKGIFKPQGKVFGRGAHRGRDDDNQLLLHMGAKVWISSAKDWRGAPSKIDVTEHKAGAIGGRYFPADDALQPPAAEASIPDEARALQALFARWYWVEPEIAPLLLLGMVGQMFICGALAWRSHVWLAGSTAAGKSSLQKIIRAIHADWVFTTEDASEAAVRQLLDNDTLPVMIDEAEAADNPERQRAMLNLAKKASSGAKIARGGNDHKGHEFIAQSAFLFSSVLHAPMLGEDRNRFAILDMMQVPAKAEQLDVNPMLAGWRAIGRKMHRRMLEQWPRFDQTLAVYKRQIHSHGYMGRWQDTYGTLLACADMLLFDSAPGGEVRAGEAPDRPSEVDWVLRILPMMVRSRTEARSDDERIIAYLQSLTLPGANGAAPETIGQWLWRAMEPRLNDSGDELASDAVNETARARLKSVGLRLVTLEPGRDGRLRVAGEPMIRDWQSAYLAIAYPTCKPLADLFKGSDWANGGWLQSFGKVQGVQKGMKVRFTPGSSDNAIAVPLMALKGEE